MGKEAELKKDEKELTRTICIPCEDTKFTAKLIEWAKGNVIRPQDKICLVAVRANVVKVGNSWPKTIIDFVCAYNSKEDEKVLMRLEKFKECFKEHQVELKVLHGDLKTVLVDFIQNLKPSVAILGRCRMHEAKKMLVGHLSDYLVMNLKVPTLIYSFD
jgi:Universal stress protein family